MSSDFGDSLSVTEILQRKEALFQIMVSERSSDPTVRDDLMQEARITAWKIIASDREFDNRDHYLHAAAKRRIVEARDRQTWTGHTRVQGQPTDPLRQAGKAALDDLMLTDYGLALVASDVLHGVEMAYHEGEIHAAIRSLPEQHRELVYRKYWLGMTEKELAAIHEVSVGTISRWWITEIRPVLRERLAHLVDA